MEKFNNINTEPNVNSNIVEQDNNPEHLKPDSLKVEKDLGKVALYRVMNLDYHPDAKKNDETGEYEYIVNNQQYPEQGDFAYSDGVGRAIDRAYPRQLHNVYEVLANEETLKVGGETTESPEVSSGLQSLEKEAGKFDPEKALRLQERDKPKDKEIIEKMPEYLGDIDDERRTEIIDSSAEMTDKIPDSIIMGGNALRILYEAKTGKKMFGVGKNDSDIYVPRESIGRYMETPPEGYRLKHELEEDGSERWLRPEEGYIVFMPNDSHEHIDVMAGNDDNLDSEMIELDGKQIRVQTLTSQIVDKLKLWETSDGLKDIPIDPAHNPDPISKYGVYAQKLLEIVDSVPLGEIDESKLPEGWRDTLEMMASQGKYGIEIGGTVEEQERKKNEMKERLEAYKKRQEEIQKKKDALVAELSGWYNDGMAKNAPLPPMAMEYVGAYSDTVMETATKSDTAVAFIRNLLTSLSRSELEQVRNKLESH